MGPSACRCNVQDPPKTHGDFGGKVSTCIRHLKTTHERADTDVGRAVKPINVIESFRGDILLHGCFAWAQGMQAENALCLLRQSGRGRQK